MADVAAATPCTPTDEGFDVRRRALVWQAIKPERYPHAIYPISSQDDIVEALAYARARGLRVSIVSGGHSYIGHGVRDGTLLLDLSRLKRMAIDVENRCCWVEPGVRVAEFEAALERAELAFPFGHDANVGLVGYLLGGGMGWNPDSWGGMACFNVTAAEIILASGDRLFVDADHHPDLFWAVRGAGPNFCGVVTKFHVRLFPRPAVIRKSDYVFPLDALDRVLAWLEGLRDEADERIELSLAFATESGCGEANVPQKRCIVSLIAFADSDIEAADLVAPYAHSVPTERLVSRLECVPKTFRMLLDEAKGDSALRRAVESIWTDDPYSAAPAIASIFAAAPSDDSIVYIGLRKVGEPLEDAACSMMARSFVFVDAAWRSEADDAANREWVGSVVTGLQRYDKGGYINETDWECRPERVSRCYTTGALRRLKDVNGHRDPGNVFVKPFEFV